VAGALVAVGVFVSTAAEVGGLAVVVVAAGAVAGALVSAAGAGAAAGVFVSVLGAELMSAPLLQPVKRTGSASAARQRGRMERDFIVVG
jgi:hypothetical protein